MKVKITKKGELQPECGCGTWLRHWENNSHIKKGLCSVRGCNNPADVTAEGHVYVTEADDNFNAFKFSGNDKWYVIPICKTCDVENSEYEIEQNIIPVFNEETDQCGQ